MVLSVLLSLRSLVRSRAALDLEILALRHQLQLSNVAPTAPWSNLTDRLLWVWLSRTSTKWRTALVLVNRTPSSTGTAVASVSSGPGKADGARPTDRAGGRPRVDPQDVAREPALGCASHPRRAAKARDRAESVHRRKVHGPSPTATVADLANVPGEPIGEVMAADFFVVPTATYRLLFVLVILARERRRVVHVAVTDHPTSAWTVRRLATHFPTRGGSPACSTIATPRSPKSPARSRP